MVGRKKTKSSGIYPSHGLCGLEEGAQQARLREMRAATR